MPFLVLAKPSSHSGYRLSGTSAIGGTNAASGMVTPSFFIKFKRGQFRHQTRFEKTTGDGDKDITRDHDGYTDVAFSCIGYALSGQAIGIANLATQTAQDGLPSMRVLMSSTRKLSYINVVVENADVVIDGDGPFIPVTLTGYANLAGTPEPA